MHYCFIGTKKENNKHIDSLGHSISIVPNDKTVNVQNKQKQK